MAKNLLDETVNELMRKFGAGEHKPGSGSAAAFNGMVSAKLISTVISLTLDEKRKHLYAKNINVFLDFQIDLEDRIYPQLCQLFIEDSLQFDKTIQARKARDREKDEFTKNQLRRQALEDLKVSITLPFEIAFLCKEIAEIAAFVFDNGFTSARGDSQVSLSTSVSSMAGCISIIKLNILSFNSDEYNYCENVVAKLKNLDKDYHLLRELADSKIDVLSQEFNKKIPLFEGINKLLTKYKGKNGYLIEVCVQELQNLIWENKHLIWKKDIPSKYLEILQPNIILKNVMGYDYFSSTTYGYEEDNKEFEVLGIIDQQNKIVAVSNNSPKHVQKFTAAHELAHAVLHHQSIMHRDIKHDGNGKPPIREKSEIQADKFAAYFLMPTKLLILEFQKRFGEGVFKIDEDSAFKFGGRTIVELNRECKNTRDLSVKLASTSLFNGSNFISLSEMFKVSIITMAIRLEELNLLKY